MNNKEPAKLQEVPIWFKSNLTIEETAAYSNIGISTLYELTNKEDCPFLLRIGRKRLIKRKKFDEYIENIDVIKEVVK